MQRPAEVMGKVIFCYASPISPKAFSWLSVFTRVGFPKISHRQNKCKSCSLSTTKQRRSKWRIRNSKSDEWWHQLRSSSPMSMCHWSNTTLNVFRKEDNAKKGGRTLSKYSTRKLLFIYKIVQSTRFMVHCLRWRMPPFMCQCWGLLRRLAQCMILHGWGKLVNAALLSLINEVCVWVYVALHSSRVNSSAPLVCRHDRVTREAGRIGLMGRNRGGGDIEWRCTYLFILPGF